MPLPYEIIETSGAEALERLRNLSLVGGEQGFVPVMLGGREDLERFEEAPLEDTSVQEEIARFYTQSDDAEELLGRLRAEMVDGNDEEFEDNFDTVTVADVPTDVPPAQGLTAHLELTGKQRPKPSVFFAKIPTQAEPWLIPIYLGLGGWNACPEAVDHAILAKYWNEKYGARIVSATHDVVEYEVERPPTTSKEALQLAKEQYVYCSDIVDQGVGDIETLAAGLLNAKTWYFWWD